MAILKNILFRVYGNDLADNYGSAMDDYLTIKDEKQRAIMRSTLLWEEFCFIL